MPGCTWDPVVRFMVRCGCVVAIASTAVCVPLPELLAWSRVTNVPLVYVGYVALMFQSFGTGRDEEEEGKKEERG